jgi:hypothetical protein
MDDFIHDADFFYALAPLILQNEQYCNWFCGRPTVMDNGLHEEGVSLKTEDILHAASLIQPEYIIPRDAFYDSKETLKGFYEMASILGGVDRLWPVVQGKSRRDIEELTSIYSKEGCKHLCIPYRLGRYRELLSLSMVRLDVHYHFLGVNNLEELKVLRMIPGASIDTGKPFRWAQSGGVWPNTDRNFETNDAIAPYNLPKLDMEKDFNPNLAKRAIMKIKEITEFETT